jgi:hypothetical protein
MLEVTDVVDRKRELRVPKVADTALEVAPAGTASD